MNNEEQEEIEKEISSDQKCTDIREQPRKRTTQQAEGIVLVALTRK